MRVKVLGSDEVVAEEILLAMAEHGYTCQFRKDFIHIGYGPYDIKYDNWDDVKYGDIIIVNLKDAGEDASLVALGYALAYNKYVIVVSNSKFIDTEYYKNMSNNLGIAETYRDIEELRKSLKEGGV